MRRACVASIAVGLLAVLALPAQAVLLRFSPKVGVTTKHKLTMAGRTEVAGAAMPEPMRMEMEVVMNSAQKALSETAEAVKVETRLTDSNMTMTVAGQTHEQAMPTMKIVVRTDRRGRTLSVEEADLGGDAMLGQMMPGGAETWGSWASFSAFPEKDVKAGAKWTDEIPMASMPGLGDMGIKSTSELLALTTFQGRECAKIRTLFEAPMNLDLSEMGAPGGAEAGSMEGLLKGAMVWYYDYKNSVYAYLEGTMEMTMTMDMGDALGGSVNTKTAMNLKMTLVK